MDPILSNHIFKTAQPALLLRKKQQQKKLSHVVRKICRENSTGSGQIKVQPVASLKKTTPQKTAATNRQVIIFSHYPKCGHDCEHEWLCEVGRWYKFPQRGHTCVHTRGRTQNRVSHRAAQPTVSVCGSPGADGAAQAWKRGHGGATDKRTNTHADNIRARKTHARGGDILFSSSPFCSARFSCYRENDETNDGVVVYYALQILITQNQIRHYYDIRLPSLYLRLTKQLRDVRLILQPLANRLALLLPVSPNCSLLTIYQGWSLFRMAATFQKRGGHFQAVGCVSTTVFAVK